MFLYLCIFFKDFLFHLVFAHSDAEKGMINNKVSNHLMRLLEKNGIPTHLIEELSYRETLVKKVTIVPGGCFHQDYSPISRFITSW